MSNASDIELLQNYDRQGSEEAFAELVERHVSLVYSVAFRRVGIAAQAEEITQAVIIILARKAAHLRPDTVLEGWLYETARLTSLSFMRSERRRQFREQEAYMQSTLQESTDASIWNQLAPLLDEGMAHLGKKDCDAVILRFFKEKSAREVAATMQVNEGAAQRRILRALEKLRIFFTKRGVSSTAAIIAGAISANSVQAAPVALAKSVTTVAIVKGAAASGSTLTLIKGALKIMAWEKMKTTALASVVILLAAGTTMVAAQHQYEHRHDVLLKNLGEDFMKNPASVGLSIGFFNNGKSYFYNFGTTEKGKVSPPSQNTVYEIGSITKTFDSFVLANAVAEGKVKMDDDIRKYLDGDYPNLEHGGKGITLEELANTTSGLPNFLPAIPNEVSQNLLAKWQLLVKLREHLGQKDFYDALHTVQMNTAPGFKSTHSNAAANLLCFILEGVYKTPIDRLIHEYISGPLAMTNTSFSTSITGSKLLAKGYGPQGDSMPYMSSPLDIGAGGLDSSTADLVKLIQLQLAKTNRVVELSHEKTFDAGYYGVALTWLIHKHENGDHQLWCDGTTLGFSSYLVIYPELNSGIVLLANECDASTPDKLGGIAYEIFKEISQK